MAGVGFTYENYPPALCTVIQPLLQPRDADYVHYLYADLCLRCS